VNLLIYPCNVVYPAHAAWDETTAREIGMTKTMRFGMIASVALLAPLVALAGGGGIKFTDAPDRVPADSSPPDTSSIDVDLIDVDADGDLDLFVAEGTAGPAGRPNRLLINDGAGAFTDESAARLPPLVSNSSRSDFGDVDGDGDLDLLVANLGPEELLLNDGHGVFVNASAQLPPPPSFLQGISAEGRLLDVDGDGDLDALIANENPFAPGELAGGQDRLYVNDGTGHFTDQTATRLPAINDQTGGFATGDIDGDGDADVIVLNRGQDRVFVNDGAGGFSDQTAARLPTTSDTSRAGALADLDDDGDLDLLVANSRGELPRRYTNDGAGVFTEVAFATTTDYPHETLTSVEVGDVDLDGDLDVVLGNAGAFLSGHGFTGGQSLLFRNDHGKLKDRTAHTLPALLLPSTDTALGDVDGDGDLDLVTGNSGAPERLALQKGD